jgi:DNA modification methylase
MSSQTGTSIFDPVLCELMYRWFAPEGGTVLDPFAGGSVRGLVAASLGHPYTGIDLSRRQIEANRAQAGLLSPEAPVPEWIAADSRTALAGIQDGVDLVFSCPPYFDLEVYSDDPADISAMSYPDFAEAYDDIIAQAVGKLRRGRFAVFVVSEVRGPTGPYRGLVPHTIRAFERAGAAFYNEIVLVNSIGSLPIRITKQFEASRKIGRTHQNVLVFVKGGAPERGWSYDREAPADPQASLWAKAAVATTGAS